MGSQFPNSLVERMLQKTCKFLKIYSGNTREEDKLDYRIVIVVRKNQHHHQQQKRKQM